METQEENLEKNSFRSYQQSSVLTQIFLRTISFGATLAATCVMATNSQSIDVFGFILDAKYSYSPAFRFFVGGNAIVSAYSLLSTPFIWILNHQGSDLFSWYLFFLLDLVMMGMVIGATSAGTAVAYVGLYGNSHTGWAAICDRFGKFCDRIIISLVCSFAAIFPFFLLTAILAKPKRIQPTSTSSSAN